MSYRLDTSTGRFVLTNDRTIRPSRLDDSFSGTRIVSQSTSPASFRTQLVRVNSQNRFFNQSSSTSTPMNTNELVYIPSRIIDSEQSKAQISHLKNQIFNIKAEADKLAREDNIGSSGLRRIIFTSGKRAFDSQTIQKASVNPEILGRDIPTVIREPITNTIESRVYIREGNITSSRTQMREATPFVRQFNLPQNIQKQQSSEVLQSKIKQLQDKIKSFQEQNASLLNQSELLKDQIQHFRSQNNKMQVELGSLKQVELQYVNVRQHNDILFDQNTALKNQLSLLNSQIQHSNVLKRQSAAIVALQEENSNLKSQIGTLLNLKNQNESMATQIAALRELQNQNSQLRTQLLTLHNIQNQNNALKSQLSSIKTQLTLANNELNMLRAKSGSQDSQFRQLTDSLNNQIQKVCQNLAAFENLQRNIQIKFGYQSLSVDQFVDKIYLMLADNFGMMQALQLKESQLQQFRQKMEQNQHAIEQLTNFRRGYQDNLRIITTSHETQRQKMLDLARQLEQTKMQLKKTQQNLIRNEISHISKNQQDTSLRLLKNKDVQIIKLQAQLKSSQIKSQRLEKQIIKIKQQLQIRYQNQKNSIIQSSETRLNAITHQLSQILQIKTQQQQIIIQKQQALNQSLYQINILKQQKYNTLQILETTTLDLKRISELYILKQNQMVDIMNKLVKVQHEQNDRMKHLHIKLQTAQLELENWKNGWKQEELELRAQLDQVRTSWHSRLIRELRTFDQALKQQIQQLNRLKTKVIEKEDKIMQLRDTLFSTQGTVTALKAELEIEKLKGISDRKTQAVGFEVQMQGLKNQLDVSLRLSDSLNQKLKLITQDSKKKDEFIQKYIMGKKQSPQQKFNAQLFFKQYEMLVPQVPLKQKLQQQLKQIGQLIISNRIYAQQIARLKGIECQ